MGTLGSVALTAEENWTCALAPQERHTMNVDDAGDIDSVVFGIGFHLPVFALGVSCELNWGVCKGESVTFLPIEGTLVFGNTPACISS